MSNANRVPSNTSMGAAVVASVVKLADLALFVYLVETTIRAAAWYWGDSC